MNIIKMIAYRAETALFNLIRPFYNNNEKDGRKIIQTILSSSANLQPDYQNNKLNVTIHSQATPRANKVLKHLCEELSQTETIYPMTNLKLVFNWRTSILRKIRSSEIHSSGSWITIKISNAELKQSFLSCHLNLLHIFSLLPTRRRTPSISVRNLWGANFLTSGAGLPSCVPLLLVFKFHTDAKNSTFFITSSPTTVGPCHWLIILIRSSNR